MTTLRRLREDEHGFTLVELLATLTLLAVVMGGVTAAVVSTTRAVGTANHTMTDIAATRVALDRITRLVRSAVDADGSEISGRAALDVARAGEVVFYSLDGVGTSGAPNRVRLVVQGDSLIEEITPATGSGPPYTYSAANRRTRTLARGLQSSDLFTFWTYRDPSHPCGEELVPGSGGLSEAQRKAVDTIDVTLRIRGESGYSNEASTLVGRARLANAHQLGRVGEHSVWDALPDDQKYCD